jgi:ferredoxin-NADP reductase
VQPRRILWRLAEVIEVVAETPRTKSLLLEVPEWEGHKAGQHVDVRLTAEDGYQAQRSYSIASALEDQRLMLAVDRLDDGEVSPYLTDVLMAGEKCGPTLFVEAVGSALVSLGHDPAQVKTERFGPTGG